MYLTFYKNCAILLESGVVKNLKSLEFAQPPVPHPSATLSGLTVVRLFGSMSYFHRAPNLVNGYKK